MRCSDTCFNWRSSCGNLSEGLIVALRHSIPASFKFSFIVYLGIIVCVLCSDSNVTFCEEGNSSEKLFCLFLSYSQ